MCEASRTQEWQRIIELEAEKNRATYENYMPGSIFKLVVGHGRLEAGLSPEEIITVEPNPAQPNKGHVLVGNHTFKDLAEPGPYNFRRALKRSSNSYFITVGLRIGPEADHPHGPAAAFRRANGAAHPARMAPARSPACGASARAGATATPATSASGKTRSGSPRCKSRF